MNNLIVLAVLTTTVVVHSQTTCNDTYNVKNSTGIKQQYKKINCTNNIKCKNAVAQFAHTARNLTSNEVSFITQNFNEEFKFDPNNPNHTTSDTSTVKEIMENFTPICQRYTDVMAHKHYLQRLLFDRILNNATVIVKLTLVIIKLQFMANSLETAQMESDGGNTCVNFTPSQYITTYYSRLQARDSDPLDAMCLLQMRTRNWQIKNL